MMTGGFSELAEADSDPDVGHMMNFIASEVKNSMFQVDAASSKSFFKFRLPHFFAESELTLNLVDRVRHARSRWTPFIRWRDKLWPA